MNLRTPIFNNPTSGDKKMKYSQIAQQENLSIIRRLMTLKPGASVRDLQYTLLCNEIKFDKDYINKLKNKVIRERKYILDKETVQISMAELRDVKDETMRQMGEILLSPISKRPEKIKAMALMFSAQSQYIDRLLGVESARLELEKFKRISDSEISGRLGLVMEYLKIQFGSELKMAFNNNVLTILDKNNPIKSGEMQNEQSPTEVDKS